jgi:flagellar basal-body rod protein FlgB
VKPIEKLAEGEALMLETLNVTRMAEQLAAHAGARLGLIARNVAQADTPGYKAVDLESFATAFRQANGDGMRATRAAHFSNIRQSMEPLQQSDGGEMSPDGNTVSLSHEMVKSVEVRQQHDMALSVYRNAADIIRASLGRR